MKQWYLYLCRYQFRWIVAIIIMIAFTEKFTHLGKIARRYTLIVRNVVLGLASSEDLKCEDLCFCVPVFGRVDLL